MTRRTLWNALAIAGLVLHGAVEAASTDKAPDSAQTFMREAAADGMAEVALGNLAAERGTHADVKAFGRRMADDHSKAGAELAKLAAKKNVELPKVIDAKHKTLHDQLVALSGPAFDKAYIDEMADGHEHAVDAFKKAAASSDADVAAFASQTLPTLEEHLKEAKRVQAEVAGAHGARAADIVHAAR